MSRKRKFGTVFLLGFMLWAVFVSGTLAAAPDRPNATRPWWEQQKIRYFWGQWMFFKEDGVTWEELMRNLSQIGTTVYAESYVYGLDLEHARLAQKYGIHYFGTLLMSYAQPHAERLKARLAVNKNGLTSLEEKARGMEFVTMPPYVACPLEEKVIEEWLLKPAIEMAKSGVVDGMHIDWEQYHAGSYDKLDDNLCYCDNCFGNFMMKKRLQENIPRIQRYKWLVDKALLTEYLTNQRDRATEIFKSISERVHQIKPDFIFSSYPFPTPGELKDTWRLEGTVIGLNSPEAPAFLIDYSHYWPHERAPWWDKGCSAYRKLGIKHILGSITAGIFGGYPATEVSAVQWMYDAAINTDGYWVWFEHSWGPNDYSAYRIANQRIQATENKVGDFLLNGVQDIRFVCTVEQSGNPDLSRNIIQRTYHLADRHLVHINNVNTDIPIEVFVRFPHLPEKGIWTVRDPVSEAYYTHDGGKAVWENEDFKKGLVLSMDKRSEAWLLLSSTGADFKLEPDQKISGEAIQGMPKRLIREDHPSSGSINGSSHLIYLKTGSLGYTGAMNPVIGTSVYGIEKDGKNGKKLFGTKGNCWSPAWSHDGKRVAFSCYVNGKGQICVMNADGSNLYNASNNEFCDNSPVWSPDGKKIVVVSERDTDWEIYVMNADGSKQERLTKSAGIDRAPSWSPDGNRIAFESDRGDDFDIYLMNADGFDQHPLIARSGRNEYEPTWSPDGKQIACTTGALSAYAGDYRDIWVVNTKDGSNSYPRGLILAATAKEWWQYKNIYSICWSPDGKWIAGSCGNGIFLVSSDGKGFRELASGGSSSPYPGTIGEGNKPIGGWYFTGSASPRHVLKTFSGISWYPDGEELVFSSNMDESGYFFLYTIPTEGGKATKLEDTRSPFSHFPVWCPNPVQ